MRLPRAVLARFALAVRAAAALVVVAVAGPAHAAAAQRPNVLLIVTDDQNAGTVDAMHSTVAWMHGGGTRFDDAYVTTPQCAPSRASIMTGRYAHNTGVLGNTGWAMNMNQAITLQRYLHQAGYTTGIFGKYLNSWPLADDPPHFDRWAITPAGGDYTDRPYNDMGRIHAVPGYETTFLADRAATFIARRARSRTTPWFLMVTPLAPHAPYTPDQRFSDAPVPAWHPTPAMRDHNLADKPPYVRTHQTVVDPVAIHTEQARALMSVDLMVKRLMDQLGSVHERKNTLVIYTSDNGLLMRDDGLYGKRMPYLDAIHVPLLIRWPGHFAARADDRRRAANIDIAPTVMQAAGLMPSVPMDGRSLLQHWNRRQLLTEGFTDHGDPGPPQWASLLGAGYQYTQYDDRGAAAPFEEFYNLAADPYQLVNLLHDGNPADAPPNLGALRTQLTAARTCIPGACP